MRRAPWAFLLIICLALFGLGAARADETTSAAQTPERLALVVGNGAYPARPLPTATNDAGLIAETLARDGFDVTAGADADAATLRQLVEGFLAKAKAAGSGSVFVVYLSGYGLQYDGSNYLVPVDAKIARDADVPGAAYALADLTRALDAVPARARLYVLDLAHDGPFARDGAPLAGGLALVKSAPNSLVAANTSPGTVASPTGATYGAYARTLSTLIDASDLPATDLFEQLRLRVAAVSDGASVPWHVSQLDPDFRLGPAPRKTSVAAWTPPAGPLASLGADAAFYGTLARDSLAGYDAYLAAFHDDPLAERVRAMAAARREATIFELAVSADMPAVYWTYMRRYPRGPHLYDVRRRLALLHAQLEPPPRFDVWTFPNVGLPNPAELAILAKMPLMLREPNAPPLPAPPANLVTTALPDTADLSVPPLPVTGALPLPMPVRLTHSGTVGTIRQPFVPGYGELVATIRSSESGAPDIVITRGRSLVSRTNAESAPGKRIVTQRDAAGAVISRSVTTTGGEVATTVQTGPTGGILKKVVTRAEPGGAQTTIVSNGANKVIATVDRDKNGVVVAAKHAEAPGSPPEAPLVVKPEGPKGPVIEPATRAVAPHAQTPMTIETRAAEGPAAGPKTTEPATTKPATTKPATTSLPRTAPATTNAAAPPVPPSELAVEPPPPPPPSPPAAPTPAAPVAAPERPAPAAKATPLPPARPQAEPAGARRAPKRIPTTAKLRPAAAKLKPAATGARTSRKSAGKARPAPRRAHAPARGRRR